MEFHATVHEEDGAFWAEVQELPGCFASGRDLNELQEALIEAIEMCLTEAEAREAVVRQNLRIGGITVSTEPLIHA